MTLIEVMIVLAVIGVAAGAVSLGIGTATRASSVQAEAVRLADLVQLAADQAMVDDRHMTLRWNRDGYAFERAGGRPGSELLQPRELPRGMSLAVAGQSARIAVITGAGAGFTARLSQADSVWDVRFDGITARAQPAGTP